MRSLDAISVCALGLSFVACGDGFTADDASASSTANVASTGDGVTASSTGDSGASTSAGTGGAAPITTPMFSEGSRLQASYVDLGDGARSFISFHDSVLGEDCTFTRFRDAVVCTPAAPLLVSSYFSDPSCMEALASGAPPGECGAPRHARALEAASCLVPNFAGLPSQRSVSIHPVTSTFTSDLVYQLVGGACVMQTPPAGVGLYTIGPAIPLAQYVAAEVTREPREAPLSMEVFVGSDGSRQIARSFSGDSPCQTRSVAGNQVCVPIYGGAVNRTLYFDDASCLSTYETPFASSSVSLCSPPEYILDRQYDDDNCLVEELFRRTGSALDLPPLYLASPGGACAMASTSGLDASTYGVTFNPIELGVGSPQTLGTGRIQGNFAGDGPDAPITMLTSFTDVARGETCAVVLFDDGTARCIGSGVAAAHFFVDAGCSQPAVVITPDPCAADPMPPARGLVPSASPSCSVSFVRASGVAELMEVDLPVFTGSPGACTAADIAAEARVYVFDAAVDLGEYATVDVVMRSAAL